MSPLVHLLGWTLVHFLWQAALLGLATAGSLWALTGRNARLRYAVACVGLLAMVSAPPTTFARLQSVPARSHATAPQAPLAVRDSGTTLPPLARAQGWQGGVEAKLPWVVLVWGCGSFLMSLRLAGGWVWLQWLRRRRDTVPAHDAEQLMLLRLCQRMGVGSNLRLLLCRAVPGPTVLGWLKPVILIPPAMVTGLDPAQLELILAHELAHVLRHDYLANLLQSVAEVLFFFHPAVWWVSKQIRQERELASDDLALRFHGDALDYAQALTALEVLASSGSPFTPAPRLALNAQGGDFMSRIHRLVSPTAPTLLAPRAGLAVLLIASGAWGLHAKHQPPRPTSQAPDPVPAGTLRIRRYDADTPDGSRKAGTLDLDAKTVSLATLEQGLASLAQLPPNPSVGHVDMELISGPSDEGGRWSYRFTGVEPQRIDAIIHGQASLAPIEEKSNWLVIQRYNAFTSKGGLLPEGLNINVWAGDVPVDLVLEGLTELEAMPAQGGIPQEIRRAIPTGLGHGVRVTVNLRNVNPGTLRGILEAKLAEQPGP